MRPSFFTKRYRLVVLLGLATLLALVLVGRWLNATKRGGQGPAEPFRIAGNLDYIGATDAAAFLIAGPEGHIVLDGGYPAASGNQPIMLEIHYEVLGSREAFVPASRR